MSITVFEGASIFDGDRLHATSTLVVEDGTVVDILPPDEAPPGPRVLLKGGTLAPGFIDLQVNGGGGILLNNAPSVAGIRTICETHARLGTLGLLPTLITDAAETTRAAIAAGVAAAAEGVPGFLGLHLEGPHLDPRRKGTHDPKLIRPMTAEDLAVLEDAARRLPALLVTLAPEAADVGQIAALTAAGAIVSLGHSDASAEVAAAGFAAGAGVVTHLFNAMSQFASRAPGLVGATLAAEGVRAGLIADGVHVDPLAIRVALAAKSAPDTIFLVTDAMAVAGTDATSFTLNGRTISRRDGRLTLADGTLAGADIDMAASLRVLTRDVGLTLGQALRMATVAPALALGRPDLGRLSAGSAADLVHLDTDLCLTGVWRGGVPL